jgi:ParB family chromosome partitioning protein
MAERRPALGKGLSALIPDAPETLAIARVSIDIDIDLLEPNDYQPRGHMEDERLDNLAQSIRSNGIIQPIVVRTLDDGRYQIIAGERRWRAAQRAGLEKVPVVVKDVSAHEKQR